MFVWIYTVAPGVCVTVPMYVVLSRVVIRAVSPTEAVLCSVYE